MFCKQCVAKADREAAKAPRRHCKECGRRFTSKAHFVLYCSKGCGAKGAQRGEHRRTADPEKRALVAAQRRAISSARRKA